MPSHEPPVTTLFVDIGGVLLTNGWDHTRRKAAAEKFGLDYDEMQERHHLTFDTYEEGQLTLEEYLRRVVFYEKRAFTPDEFREHMLAQSQPLEGMIELVAGLREKYGLRVAAVSNEGRELTEHRIQTFGLVRIIDFFIASCFVAMRKPAAGIYRLALDVTQRPPQSVVYLEDRPMFVDVAAQLGIRGVVHHDLARTREALARLGLEPPKT